MYLKEYVNNVRNKIVERNLISSEYYKNKIALNEKKNKKVILEPSQWELDIQLCLKLGLDVDFIQGKPSMAWKFMFSDETKKLREYGDLFSLFNQNIYNELVGFEEYTLKALMGDFKNFAERNIENITQNHLMYAELLSEISDIQTILQKTT